MGLRPIVLVGSRVLRLVLGSRSRSRSLLDWPCSKWFGDSRGWVIVLVPGCRGLMRSIECLRRAHHECTVGRGWRLGLEWGVRARDEVFIVVVVVVVGVVIAVVAIVVGVVVLAVVLVLVLVLVVVCAVDVFEVF